MDKLEVLVLAPQTFEVELLETVAAVHKLQELHVKPFDFLTYF